MTKISKKAAYPKKTPIVDDYFVGTDSENFGKTVNFGFEAAAGLINKLNGTPLLNYVFTTSPYIDTEVLVEGRFLSFGSQLSTPLLTKLYVNKFNNSGDNLGELYLFLKANSTDFYLKLRNSNNQNNAVYFDIASIDSFQDYYILNIAVFKANTFLPTLENLNVYFFDFELKATSAGTSDPLKLDKSTYSGNASDIDERLIALESQTDVDNAFIVKPTFSLAANTLTIGALGRWRLDGVAYTNPAPVVFPITYCASGKTRLDYFVPNNLNGFTKVSGVETLGMAIAPQLPNEGLYVTYVLVSDSTVGEPTAPSTKKTPTIQQVLEAGFSTTKFIWFWNTINSKCTRFASDHILFQKLESVFNWIKSDHTTQSYTVQLPNKLGGAEQTFAMVSDLENVTVAVADVTGLPEALDLKLNTSAYNQHFRGVYLTELALNTALPTANVGDYAQVNVVGATDVVNYNWDAEENRWVANAVASSGALNTDQLPEGSTNLYFTVARFLANLTYDKVIAALGFTPSTAPNNAQKNSDITKAEIEAKITDVVAYASSDETTALTTGLKNTFRMPFGLTLSNVRISATDAPAVTALKVDIKQGGVSIFSTLIQIDYGTTTSVGSAIPFVLSTTSLTDNSIITIHVTQVGSGAGIAAGTGLKVHLYGNKI